MFSGRAAMDLYDYNNTAQDVLKPITNQTDEENVSFVNSIAL